MKDDGGNAGLARIIDGLRAEYRAWLSAYVEPSLHLPAAASFDAYVGALLETAEEE